jgi:hypothetical protein
MRDIYTSKEMSKKFGVRVIHWVRVIYRKIRYLEFNVINLYFSLTGKLQTSTALLVVLCFSEPER